MKTQMTRIQNFGHHGYQPIKTTVVCIPPNVGSSVKDYKIIDLKEENKQLKEEIKQLKEKNNYLSFLDLFFVGL